MTGNTLPLLRGSQLAIQTFRLLASKRKQFALVVVLQAMATVASLVPPIVVGRLLDSYVSGQKPSIYHSAVLLIVSLISASCFSFLATRLSFSCGESIFAKLRFNFLRNVLGLPLTTVEQIDSGEIVSRSTADLDSVHEITRTGVPEVIVGGITVFITLVAAFTINPFVALGAVIGIPFIVVSTRFYAARAPKAYEEEASSGSAVITQAAETVRGAKTVVDFGLQESRGHKFDSLNEAAHSASYRPLVLESWWFPFVQMGYVIPIFSVLFFGIVLVPAGSAQVGEVAAIVLFMRSIVTPLDDLIYWYGESRSAGVALSRILGVPGSEDYVTGKTCLPGCGEYALEMTSMSFSYTNDRIDIHDITLQINHGERVCIVGPSGSGKTTLGLLMTGALRPDVGVVRVNGEIVDAAHGSVAMVAQEDYIFNDTLCANIALSVDYHLISHVEVLRTLHAVGASWIEDLPDGLNTQIGSEGYELTPSQAKQVALARIMYTRPEILILDEATACLPHSMADSLLQGILDVMPDTTIVHIAHDLDIAKNADRILVMEHGKVTEQGNHTDLIAHGGMYASWWSSADVRK